MRVFPAPAKPLAPTLGDMCVQILAPDRALEEYGTAWRTLAEATPGATFFMWPAVFRAWLEEMSQEVVASVVTVHREGAPIAVLPVMRARVRRGPAFVPRIDFAPDERWLAPAGRRPFPLRQLSAVVSWRATSVRPTLLCHSRDRPAVTQAIAPVLAALPGIDQIALPVIEGEDEQAWCAALADSGCQPWVHRLERNVLTRQHVLPFDQIVATQNRNFRRNVKRAQAAAAQAGMRCEMFIGRDAIAPHLGEFAELAAQSWKAGAAPEGKIGIPYEGVQRRYFERILADQNSGLMPILCLATADGAPVAASLSCRHGETLTGLLMFRGPMLPTASPGMLLLAPLFDWAAKNGLQQFDLNATQDWLRHFADTRQVLATVTAFGPTLRGRLYARLAAARRRGIEARAHDVGGPAAGANGKIT